MNKSVCSICGMRSIRRPIRVDVKNGIVTWFEGNPETGKVVKCDYCTDRIDQGLKPACVTKCMTNCLHFGEPSTKTKAARERYSRAIAEL